MTVDEDSPVDDAPGPPHARRQFVISHLDEAETPITIDELADAVLEWEMQQVPTRLEPPDRRGIREELHEVDLPALSDDGLIIYNADEGLVGTFDGESSTPLELDGERPTRPADRVPWRQLVAGLLFVAILLVVAVAGFGFPATVAAITAAVLVLMTVIATSVLH